MLFRLCAHGEVVVLSDSGFGTRYHLAYGDIRFNSTRNPSWMEVRIKRLKCDQFGQGAKLSMGATDTDVCPVAAMLGFFGAAGVSSGPLFRFADGHPLMCDRFVSSLRMALGECGIDPSLCAGRSFRVGGSDDCSFSRHAGLPHKDVRSL